MWCVVGGGVCGEVWWYLGEVMHESASIHVAASGVSRVGNGVIVGEDYNFVHNSPQQVIGITSAINEPLGCSKRVSVVVFGVEV